MNTGRNIKFRGNFSFSGSTIGKGFDKMPFFNLYSCNRIAANVGEAVFVPVIVTTFQQQAVGKNIPKP
jgi:hypothetical protein